MAAAVAPEGIAQQPENKQRIPWREQWISLNEVSTVLLQALDIIVSNTPNANREIHHAHLLELLLAVTAASEKSPRKDRTVQPAAEKSPKQDTHDPMVQLGQLQEAVLYLVQQRSAIKDKERQQRISQEFIALNTDEVPLGQMMFDIWRLCKK